MPITAHQARKLLPHVQPFPGGAAGEVYISVPGVRAALGCEPNQVQGNTFYMRPDTIEEGGWARAVYVLSMEALKKFAGAQLSIARA